MCNETYHKIPENESPTGQAASPAFVYTKEMQQAHGEKMATSRADAYYKDIGDVHWEDLEFYLNNARVNQDKESFDIAAKILTALRTQVLERKSK